MSNDSNTTQRDELTEIRDIAAAVITQPLAIPQDLWPEQIALALNAAGYRKPRTITTAEELDALPAGSVIRADNGEVFEKQADGPYCDGPHVWQSFEGTFWNGETFVFPVVILHEATPDPLAAALADPEGHALVKAIHDRKAEG